MGSDPERDLARGERFSSSVLIKDEKLARIGHVQHVGRRAALCLFAVGERIVYPHVAPDEKRAATVLVQKGGVGYVQRGKTS